MDVKYLEIA